MWTHFPGNERTRSTGRDVFSVVRAGDIYRGSVVQLWFARVEAGSNTSTVTLRVVGGDEKGILESETVKYGYESHGIWTRK
jgi:hypothetical protein